MGCNCKKRTGSVKQPVKTKSEDNKSKLIEIFYGM
jgi:hypothetical protein